MGFFRKGETNKRVLWLDIFVAIILTVCVVVGDFLRIDMTQTAIVAGIWDGQLAAVIGFYSWKAKNENRSKHAMELVKEIAEHYDIDAAIRLSEIVLKD